MMQEKCCGNCEYMGAPNGETIKLSNGEEYAFHFCENKKSLFKSCIEIATGCNNYVCRTNESVDKA